MNHKNSKISKFLKGLTAFCGLPLIFVFIAYLAIYFIASPIIVPAASLVSMLVGEREPSFNELDVKDVELDLVQIGEKQANEIPVDDIDMPSLGEKYGHIFIKDTGVDCDVYYGDEMKFLRRGAGQYEKSKLPGFGSTTLVAAHVTTHFKGLQYVEIGDIIEYTTTYGAFEYEVNDIKIVDAKKASSTFKLRADHDNLVLYTCYPFHSVAFRSQRYLVYAKKISGPSVDIYE